MRVDTAGLAATGAQVAGTAGPVAPIVVGPAAPDPVSSGVAGVLSARHGQLAAVLDHGSLLCARGAEVIAHTSTIFDATDSGNASMLLGGPISAGPAVGASPAAAELPAPPQLAPMPPFSPPPTMPGDAFARLLHSGPGSSRLREAGAQWRRSAGDLRDLGDQLMLHGRNVAEQWDDDGHQRAAANLTRHADWLHSRADDHEELAAAAEARADHYDQAVAQTPSPERFDQVRNDIVRLSAANNRGQYTSAIMQKQADYADLQGQATEQAGVYHGSAVTTAAGLGRPIPAAPPIAGGHGDTQALDMNHRAPLNPAPGTPGLPSDPTYPEVGQPAFGQWEDVPPPPPYVGASPPPLKDEYRPNPDGTPFTVGPKTGMFTPGQTWIGDIDPPAGQYDTSYRFRWAGDELTTVTRVGPDGNLQRWVAHVYQYQRDTDLHLNGDLGALPHILNFDRSWHPITLPQIAQLSANNPDVKFFLPDGCGGTIPFTGGVPGGWGIAPQPPIMTAPT